jgi:general secretion pathway protein C
MKSRPPFEFIYIYLFCLLFGYIIADLGILSVRDRMIPNQAPPKARPRQINLQASQNRDSYGGIVGRNIFNSDGKIPDPVGASNQPGGGNEGPPVLSQLPLALVGTLVHADPTRSVATVNIKGKPDNFAFTVDDSIENMGKVTKIERNKMIFRNSNTQRLEFIEIKKDNKLSFATPVKTNGEVVQEAEDTFSIKKTDIDRLTSNLPELLTQARAVPNMVGGRLDGFRRLEIQPGSIYSKLGLKPNDVIKGVNGEVVDSPAKAMELYNALKNGSSSIGLEIDRDGRKQMLNYNIQ